MQEDDSHHDGLAKQRQILEQMSDDLTNRLQGMIAQQEQRAREFNALVPKHIPEISIPQELDAAADKVSQAGTTVSFEVPAQVYAPYAPPAPQPAKTIKRQKMKKSPVPAAIEEPQEEGSVSGLMIGIIIFAIFIIAKFFS